MKKTYIVVGTSAAGFNALLTLQKLVPDCTIIGLTQENGPLYNKCLLIDYLGGNKNEGDIILKNNSFPLFTLLFNKTVTHIIPETQKILVNNQEEFFYDALLLAPGTRPFIPAVLQPFMHLSGIIPFHTLSDTKRIISQADEKKTCVIIGGGINGLECATTLVKKGLQVIIIEKASTILPSLWDNKASEIIENHLRGSGITFFKETTVEYIIHKDTTLHGVIISNGNFIKTPLLIIAAGTISNTEFAPFLGQEKEKIIVNEFFQTNHPQIYGAGDALHRKDVFSLAGHFYQWSTAVLEGIHAAYSMAGQPRPYRPLPPIIQTTLADLPVCFGGSLSDKSHTAAIHSPSHNYEKIIVNKEGNLQGFVLIGKIEKALTLRKKLHERWFPNV